MVSITHSNKIIISVHKWLAANPATRQCWHSKVSSVYVPKTFTFQFQKSLQFMGCITHSNKITSVNNWLAANAATRQCWTHPEFEGRVARVRGVPRDHRHVLLGEGHVQV